MGWGFCTINLNSENGLANSVVVVEARVVPKILETIDKIYDMLLTNQDKSAPDHGIFSNIGWLGSCDFE